SEAPVFWASAVGKQWMRRRGKRRPIRTSLSAFSGTLARNEPGPADVSSVGPGGLVLTKKRFGDRGIPPGGYFFSVN
ncbi:MAG: hypothetical protein ACRDD1_09815, partial [Planctomycetia bacterium]